MPKEEKIEKPDTSVRDTWLESNPEENSLTDSLDNELKDLNQINMDRQKSVDMAPPPVPAPAPMAPAAPSEPVEPISDKDLARLLGESAKSLLDASLSIEKAGVNLDKILLKTAGPQDTDVESKVASIVGGIKGMASKCKTISDMISEYRSSIASGDKTETPSI